LEIYCPAADHARQRMFSSPPLRFPLLPLLPPARTANSVSLVDLLTDCACSPSAQRVIFETIRFKLFEPQIAFLGGPGREFPSFTTSLGAFVFLEIFWLLLLGGSRSQFFKKFSSLQGRHFLLPHRIFLSGRKPYQQLSFHALHLGTRGPGL